MIMIWNILAQFGHMLVFICLPFYIYCMLIFHYDFQRDLHAFLAVYSLQLSLHTLNIDSM